MPDAIHFSTATHEYDPMQEVRFAVVIYGGVSLAIYINGQYGRRAANPRTQR